MPGTHVALLRGINVGKAKRVAMADLRALIEGLGYRDVRTLLNSGNVVFTAPLAASANPAVRIEQAVARRLGVVSRVTALTARELAAVVRENPLLGVAADPNRLLVTVLSDPSDRARLTALAREVWTPEAFALGSRVCYTWCPDGILQSRAVKAVDRLLGDAVTSRNWATIQKLHDRIREE